MTEQTQQIETQDAGQESSKPDLPPLRSSDIKRPGGESERDYLTRKRRERQEAAAAQKAAQEPKPAAQPSDGADGTSDRNPDESLADGQSPEAVSSDADAQTVDGGDTPQAQDEYFPETIPELVEALGVDLSDFRQGMTMPVRVNGEEHTVSLDELASAYSSAAERNRLGQGLAEERKAFEARSQQQSQEWQNRLAQADAMLQAMQADLAGGPSPQELAQLAKDDEFAYMKALADRQAKTDKFNAFVQQRQQAAQAWLQEEQSKQNEFRKQQQEGLLAWKPELREPAKLSEFEGKARAALTGHYGYSDDDVAKFFSNFDLRALKILDDALTLREMKRQEKPMRQRLQQLPKLQKPGPRRSDAQKANDNVLAARNRLKSGGTREDAVNLLRARRAQRKQQRDSSQ